MRVWIGMVISENRLFNMLKNSLHMKAAALGLVASSSLLFGTFAFADNGMNPSSDDPFVTQSQSGPAVSTNTASSFADTTGIYAQLEGYYSSSPNVDDQVLTSDELVNGYTPPPKTGKAPAKGTGYSAATATQKTNGFGGRLSVGYDLSRWFGVEVGFLMNQPLKSSLKDVKDNSTATAKDKPSGKAIADKPTIGKLSSYGMDVLAKARVPLTQSIYAFAGAGAVWMHYKSEETTDAAKYLAGGKGKPISWSQVAPEVEAGLGVGLSKNMAVDVAYKRIFGSDMTQVMKSNTSNKLPDSVITQNIVSLGVAYKFPL